MKEVNYDNLNVKNKKKLIIILVIILLIIIITGGVTLYIFDTFKKKSNHEIGQEIYNNLINIHNRNVLICKTSYNGWVYSKSTRGSFSNTLYQQLEREYSIPFEFTLDYYNLTEDYNSKDIYGQIEILNDIDSKLENDIVFVILKYYNNEINNTALLLNQVKENLKQLDNNYKHYDTLTDLYSGEVKLNDFTKNPKGTLIELSNLISEVTEKYDDNIIKLEVEYEI